MQNDKSMYLPEDINIPESLKDLGSDTANLRK